MLKNGKRLRKKAKKFAKKARKIRGHARDIYFAGGDVAEALFPGLWQEIDRPPTKRKKRRRKPLIPYY